MYLYTEYIYIFISDRPTHMRIKYSNQIMCYSVLLVYYYLSRIPGNTQKKKSLKVNDSHADKNIIIGNVRINHLDRGNS